MIFIPYYLISVYKYYLKDIELTDTLIMCFAVVIYN